MRQPEGFRNPLATLTVLLLVLLTAAPLAFAADGPDDERKVSRHRWVVKGPGMLGGGYLGIQALEMTPELRRHHGAPEDAGVLVGRVLEESPASAAGLRVGDIVTDLNGEALASPFELVRALGKLEEGDSVSLEVWRDGRRLQLSASLGKRPEAAIQTLGPGVHFIPNFAFDFNFKGLDLDSLPELENLGRDLGQYFSSPEWKHSLKKMEVHRGDLAGRLKEMEKRLEEMEKRLSELGEEP